MGFFKQLRLLLWKNYIIRRRQKLRLSIEIVWPLLLFLILTWVRTRGLRTFKSECYYDERALPSAGFLPFLQTFYCTFSNPCHSTAENSRPYIRNFTKLNIVILESEEIFRNSIKLEHINSLKSVNEDLFTVIPSFLLTYFRSNRTDIKGNVYLEWFQDSKFSNIHAKLLKKNATRDTYKNVYIYINDLSDIIQMLLNGSHSIKHLICKTKLLQSKDTNELFILKNYLCNLTESELGIIIDDLLSNSGVIIIFKLISETMSANSNGRYFLNTEDWTNVYYLAESITKQVFQTKAAQNLFVSFSRNFNENMLQLWSEPLSYFNRIVCGRTSTFKEPGLSIEGGLAKLDEMGRKFQVTLVTAPEIELEENSTSKKCWDLFENFSKSKFGGFVWRQIKPFVLGKILYSPNNTATNMIMEKVKEHFKVIDDLLILSQQWLGNISPGLQKYLLNTPEVLEFLQKITDINFIKSNQFYKQTWKRLSFLLGSYSNGTEINEEHIVLSLHSYLSSPDILEDWKLWFETIDFIVEKLHTFLECFDQNKLQPMTTEDDAQLKALELIAVDRLWAVVAFQNVNGDDNDTLPPHIVYKLRMDAGKVDSTKRVRDRISRPGARANPFIDLKYFTFGFIYLQDMVERAIISLQTEFEMLPGMWMKQFPYPCYIYDQFILAISRTFPMFMVLSWVYPAAMIIKTVVHEKEKRLKEMTKVMGLGNGVHWLGWFINSFTVMMASVVFLTIILKFGDILIRSDVTIIWIFLTLYMCATINFSFLISTFFSRANISAAAGGIIFFVTYLPYPFLILWEEELSGWEKALVSIFSNVGFGFGCSYFAQYEEIGIGIQWSNLAQSPMFGDSFNMSRCMMIMAFNCFFYGFLAMYIEAVFPGQYGIPKPWYNPFGLSICGRPTKLNVSDQIEEEMVELQGLNVSDDNHEKEPADLQLGIRIQNLKKTYDDGKVAINNLNMSFYEDQITSFLGHNGAGKTTTISILTGLFPPTSGTVYIYGLDIRTHMDTIRKSLGTCPQHNVLFDHLTVEEHLLFYSQLRGKLKEKKELKIELKKMIDDIGLPHKKDELVRNLSGGMQRKLSVGIAFVGGSRTVILDEPTAGVDPYSRRAIWELLLKYKKGRTILLTTHHMDEADLLGDRIAIVSNGRLCCSGSSLFLKRRYATGYYLTLARFDNSDEQKQQISETEVTLFIKSHVKEAWLCEDVGTELVYVLPTTDNRISAFSHLFDALDQHSSLYGIASYGVADTTLDEIFLKVAKENVLVNNCINGVLKPAKTCIIKKPKCLLSTKVTSDVPHSSVDVTSASSTEEYRKIGGWRLVRKHITAINIKRFHHTRRDMKALFCEIVLPPLFVCLALTFTLILPPMRMEPALHLHPWLYGSQNYIFFSNENPNDHLAVSYENKFVDFPGMGTRCVNNETIKGKPCLSSSTNSWTSYSLNENQHLETLKPCSCETGIQVCPVDNVYAPFSSKLVSTSDILLNATGRNISEWLMRTERDYYKKRYGGVSFGINNPLSLINMPALRNSIDRFLNVLSNDSSKNNISLELEKGLKNLPIFNNIKVWFNNQGWASSVSYLNAINNVVLRAHLKADQNPNIYGITVINHPLNFTRHQLEIEVIKRSGISLLHAICIMFAMSFVPASFILYLIEERVSKSKHLQFVTGLRPVVYWLSNFIWDNFNYFVSSILCIFIFIIFNEEAYVSSTNFPGLVLLLILYGWATIPSMYPAAFVFNVPSTAFVALASTNLFIGVVSTVSTFILELMDDQELQDIANLLKQIFLIFPHYCLGRGLIEMATSHLMLQSLQKYGIEAERDPLSWDFLGRNLVCMFVQGVVMFTMTLLIEYKFFTSYFRQKSTFNLNNIEDEEEVGRERANVLSGRLDSSILKITNLTKVYNNWRKGRCSNKKQDGRIIAVDRLCFAVGSGQCFGLLGVNGAGKTTFFKMATRDTDITSGDVFINGFSVREQMDQARQHLGYCPQFDALDHLLTAEEHLTFYANIRGIVNEDVRKSVQLQISKMNLGEYAKMCAGKYSGGNKRKLSTAIALVGNPSLIFLDEPTTGMDPRARRFLWNCVSDLIKEGRSLILTSHSLEECEALCTRLAVMVNGRMCCIGSIQHLKNKFGNGYSLTIRISSDSSDNLTLVKAFIFEKFPLSTIVEEHHNQLVYHLPSRSFALSTLFNEMENAKERLKVEDYSISQTTLDQVFINFAKQQDHLVKDS